MEEIDKRIIPMKMKLREHVTMSLEDGYYVDGELVKFIKTTLFDGNISAFLPESFVDMPSQVVQLKYPSLMRPQIIRTNLQTDVNFTFSIMENPELLSPENIINGFGMTLARTNPAIHVGDCHTETIGDGIEISYFEFVTFGLDEHIYNLSCMTAVKGEILHAMFNCLERDRQDWNVLAKDVFFNLEIQN